MRVDGDWSGGGRSHGKHGTGDIDAGTGSRSLSKGEVLHEEGRDDVHRFIFAENAAGTIPRRRRSSHRSRIELSERVGLQAKQRGPKRHRPGPRGQPETQRRSDRDRCSQERAPDDE